jgi:hypothetical protein
MVAECRKWFYSCLLFTNTGDVTHANIYQGWLNGESYHTEQLEGIALKEHYDWLMSIPSLKKFLMIWQSQVLSGRNGKNYIVLIFQRLLVYHYPGALSGRADLSNDLPRCLI